MVERAIQITTQVFRVQEGLRTRERQAELGARGVRVPVCWGGCWDSLLAIASPEDSVADDVAACRQPARSRSWTVRISGCPVPAGMIAWIKTAQRVAAIVAAIFATMLAWWNPGLPRLVPSPEQMSDMQPVDLNSASLDIGRHVSGIADPFNGDIDAFRISHIQRSDGWIETTYNNLSNPGAFAVTAVEEQEGGEPPPLSGAGVVVCLMG